MEAPVLLLALLPAALAGGPWSGIAAESIAGLGPVVFLEPAGWSASVEGGEGGDVRVFVARTDAEATEWLATRRSEESWTVPPWPFADEAWGNGHALLGFRDGNVAAVVRMEAGGAAAVAEHLRAALAPETAWPTAPAIALDDTLATVAGEWAYVAFRPSPLLDPATLLPREIRAIPVSTTAARLDARPKRMEVIAWDRFGRAASATWP